MPSRPSRISKRRSNKKWCPVITQQDINTSIAATSQKVSIVTLCSNSANVGGTAPTSTVIKAGNFKVVVDVNVSSAFNGSGRMYVMYCPQGIGISSTDTSFITQHPEWIMCWRGFEPGTSGLQAVSMQSKLKRNLNSGDTIILITDVNNYSSNQSQIVYHATCTYVCCAN